MALSDDCFEFVHAVEAPGVLERFEKFILGYADGSYAPEVLAGLYGVVCAVREHKLTLTEAHKAAQLVQAHYDTPPGLCNERLDAALAAALAALASPLELPTSVS